MVTTEVPFDEVETADSQNPVTDLSGVDTSAYGNPYDALLETDAADIAIHVQQAYETHRTTRNALKKVELLDHNGKGIVTDPILSKLEDPKCPDYVDPRNSLVFWARPPQHVIDLALHVQQALQKVMPAIWLMPPEDMHMTVLEVVHSVPMDEVMEIANKLSPIIPELISLPTETHGCTLFRPQLSYDSAAVALSFIPYAQPPTLKSSAEYSSESSSAIPSANASHRSSVELTPGSDISACLDPFNVSAKQTTYHHLRGELYQRIVDHGIPIASRYVVPSAHITLCRFLDYCGGGAFRLSAEIGTANRLVWTQTIDGLNEELRLVSAGEPEALLTSLPTDNNDEKKGLLGSRPWVVSEELVCRVGALWYGGGWTYECPEPGKRWVRVEENMWRIEDEKHVDRHQFHACFGSDCSLSDEMEGLGL